MASKLVVMTAFMASQLRHD